MRDRCQVIFDELVSAVQEAIGKIITEHGAAVDVVREVRASLDVLATDIAGAPFAGWFRNVTPDMRHDVDSAVDQVDVEELFSEGHASRSKLPH